MKHLTVEQDDKLRSWAVGNCGTGKELSLVSRLTGDGFEAWTPSRRLETPSKPMRAHPIDGITEKAAIPGYFFLPTAQPNGETLLGARAVAWRKWGASFVILMSGGEFGKVSGEVVAGLREKEAAGGFNEVVRLANSRFKIGDRIYVNNGPMHGYRGIALCCRRHHTLLGGPEFPKPAWLPNSILLLDSENRV